MIQPKQDKSKLLYDAVSKDYEIGTYDEFKTKLQSPEKRKSFYEGVGSEYSLGTYDEFESKINNVKKKVGTQPTGESTIPAQKLVSETSTGSLGGVDQNNPFTAAKPLAPIKLNEFKDKSVVANDNALLAKAKSNRVKELETSFYASTKDNTDDAVAEQRLQDRKANNGFWNTAEDLTKSVYNKVVGGIAAITDEPGIRDLKINTDPLADDKKQALAEAKKNKITLTETQKNLRAEDIFKQKVKDNLFLDRANSYLDNLDVKDKDILKQDRYDKGIHLQEDNIKKINVVSAMKIVGDEKIKEYQDVEKQLLSLQEKNQQAPKELYDKYIGLSGEIKEIGGNIQKYSDQIQKNKVDLGTVKEEFDLFKREYGDVDNFINNTIATSGDLANGLFGAVNYLGSLSPNPIDRINSMKGQVLAGQISGKLEEYRGTLRKSGDSIESVEGFVNYASDLVANQLPILAVTSTGIGGLATLGATTTGNTFTKINEEFLTGKEKYTPLQMMAVPLLQGGFEVISEIPTLSILKKGSRVIAAAARGEVDLIKKSGAEIFKGYVKDFSKEFGGEHFTNFGQNFNAKYVQGKDEVGLLDNTGRVTKDTFFLTNLLQGSPHVFGAVAKVFQSSNDLGTLDENSRKIIEFSKQIEVEGLTDTEKTVIQKQIDKATAESSKIIATTIGSIDSMPNISFDNIVSLNAQAGKIKAQAFEIKEGNLPNKKELLASLGQEYKDLQTKRSGIIDGSVTPVELLEIKDLDKIKKEALKELTAEQNPDGKKDLEIDDKQISERANKNYLKQIKNAETQSAVTNETEPQAEVQKPTNAEQEKVAEVSPEVAYVEKRRQEDLKEQQYKGLKTQEDLTNYNEGETSIIGQGLKEIRDDIVNAEKKGLITLKEKKLAQAKINAWLTGGMSLAEASVKIREEFGITVSAGKWQLAENRRNEINAKYDAELEALKPKETPKPQEASLVEDVVAPSVEKKITDVEKEIKELEDVRDNGKPLKPLTFVEDYSQEELDNMEKRHQRDVKEHISDINKQIAQKQTELEDLKNASTPSSSPPTNGNLPIGDNTDLQQGKVETVQPATNVAEGKTDVKGVEVQKLEKDRDNEIANATKPDMSLQFVDEKRIPKEIKRDILFKGKKISEERVSKEELIKEHNELKEKGERLKELIDCITKKR